MTLSNNFFDLSSFAHKDLFYSKDFVWTALNRLKHYFLTLTFGRIKIELKNNIYFTNKDQVSIGENSHIDPGVFIEGPCLIGKNTVIRHGAYIRPYSIIGDRCVIGHCSEVKHSIMLNDSKAPHFNYIGNSIIGNYVNLGAGVKCANFRFDGGPITVSFGGVSYHTNMNKLGSIIGDFTQVGCNAVLNPGVLIGKKSLIKPCEYVKRSIMEK